MKITDADAVNKLSNYLENYTNNLKFYTIDKFLLHKVGLKEREESIEEAACILKISTALLKINDTIAGRSDTPFDEFYSLSCLLEDKTFTRKECLSILKFFVKDNLRFKEYSFSKACVEIDKLLDDDYRLVEEDKMRLINFFKVIKCSIEFVEKITPLIDRKISKNVVVESVPLRMFENYKPNIKKYLSDAEYKTIKKRVNEVYNLYTLQIVGNVNIDIVINTVSDMLILGDVDMNAIKKFIREAFKIIYSDLYLEDPVVQYGILYNIIDYYFKDELKSELEDIINEVIFGELEDTEFWENELDNKLLRVRRIEPIDLVIEEAKAKNK